MLEDLIRSVGTEQFSRTAFRLLQNQFARRHLVIARYAQHKPIEILAVECAGSENIFYPAIDHYMRTSYLGDPLRSQYHGSENCEHVLFSVAAEQVQDAEARERLYRAVGIAGKLSLLIRRAEDVLTLSVYRAQNVGRFERQHVERMRTLSGTLAATVERHVEILQPTALNSLDELCKLLADIPRGSRLSRQEIAVCARIVTGHSTESIALNLGISTHSVATYRRRAYAKLNVSSQNELFLLLLGLCSRRPASGPGYARLPVFAGRQESAMVLRQ
jgi:DNA-binding CsgD family transcriptional regulator